MGFLEFLEQEMIDLATSLDFLFWRRAKLWEFEFGGSKLWKILYGFFWLFGKESTPSLT